MTIGEFVDHTRTLAARHSVGYEVVRDETGRLLRLPDGSMAKAFGDELLAICHADGRVEWADEWEQPEVELELED